MLFEFFFGDFDRGRRILPGGSICPVDFAQRKGARPGRNSDMRLTLSAASTRPTVKVPAKNAVLCGDVAQLAEHLLCKQGVVGSNPIVSTLKAQVRGPGLSLWLGGDCRRSQFERSLWVHGYVWGFVMASRPTVRWNESAGRWMAWVRFPDGTRRKVERVDKAAAQKDLDELVALRAQSLDPGPRRERLAAFARGKKAWVRG